MEPIEEWINCIEGEDYEISNFGNFRRKMNNGTYKIIGGSILNCGKGYKYFQMKRDGKRKNILFHHLVAKCFIGERPDKYDIDHIDRNSLNNNVNNLRYVTHKENCRNTNRYREDIEEPNDKKERTKLLHKDYNEKNRDKVLLKNIEYNKKNKDLMNAKNKEKYSEEFNVVCSVCNETRIIKKKMYLLLVKREGGIESNICKICNSLKNLEKINDLQSKIKTIPSQENLLRMYSQGY